MAEIPVERKNGGIPWWVWLLGALLLLALLGLLARGCNDRDDNAAIGNVNTNVNATNVNTANVNTSMNANANANMNADMNANANARMSTQGVGTATGERVTDVNIFGSTADKQSLVGRRVDVQNVRVNRVLSDRVFTVTAGSGELFVLLDDKLDSPGGRENQIKAREGQLVNLGGTFQSPPARSLEVQDDRKDGSLNAREFQQMAGQQVYLHATEARNANQ